MTPPSSPAPLAAHPSVACNEHAQAVTLFAGSIRPLEGESRLSGIYKQALHTAVWIGPEGLAGDEQADRRVHGGVHKAVHHFPLADLARLAAAFPERAAQLLPGSMGENISAAGWDETQVAIGDVFALGEARLRICQPRIPCWKIDQRHACNGMAQHLANSGFCGWYYEVLQAGTVAPGEPLRRIERPAAAHADVSLAQFGQLWREHRPSPDVLHRLAALPGLSPNWLRKINERIDWLKRA